MSKKKRRGGGTFCCPSFNLIWSVFPYLLKGCGWDYHAVIHQNLNYFMRVLAKKGKEMEKIRDVWPEIEYKMNKTKFIGIAFLRMK